jgi:TonB family protein
MQTRRAKRARATRRASLYSISLLLLFAAPASAQPVQPAAPPAGPPPSVPPAGTPPSTSMENFVPALPPSVVPPRIEAPYPCRFSHSAVYEHPTGPTIVTFTVTAQGRVTNTSIAQSSGSGVVDEGVRNCVSSFIYAPAIRDGQPVDVTWAYEYNLTITRSRVPPALPPDAPQGTKFVMMPVWKNGGDCDRWHRDAPRPALVAFDVEPDGSVKNASVAGSSGDAAIDKDAVDCVSRRIYKPATRDGEPVEFRLTSELFAGR